MISVVAKWTIAKGKNERALIALEQLADRVYANSPFVLMYTIHIPNFEMTSFPTPPEQEVVFYSVFDGSEGFQKHMTSQVFNDWMREYRDLFLTKGGDLFVVSEFLHRKAGFIRPAMIAALSRDGV
jgi:quinol monooxygenase YgiN